MCEVETTRSTTGEVVPLRYIQHNTEYEWLGKEREGFWGAYCKSKKVDTASILHQMEER
jgi:hypothetical protein